jgi:hypothetical protein
MTKVWSSANLFVLIILIGVPHLCSVGPQSKI